MLSLSPQHEQIEACLKDLFEVPTKNIESAFQLVLGLLRDQNHQLEQAHEKALQDNEAVRISMQNAVDKLVKEKGELANDLNELKVEHGQLLKSYEKTAGVVDELRQEIEVRMSEVYIAFYELCADRYTNTISLLDNT